MDWIVERFESFGDRTACLESGRNWTYADLICAIVEAGEKLSAQRVITLSTEHCVEGLATILAIATTKHIALPIAHDIAVAERTQIETIAGLGPSPEPELFDQLPCSGLILFSSGTSGEPKAMLHDLPALLNRFRAISQRKDRCLLLLRPDHIGGLDTAFRCLFAGSTLVIPESRTPESAAEAIQNHQVNILPASPTFLNLMLLQKVSEHYDCSSLEIIAYGAETMPQALLLRLHKAFPNVSLEQKFGTSETGALRTQSSGNESLFFRIKDADTEWKIIDQELWLKTPSRILGYLNFEPHGLENDGWYRTGDIVEEGADGYIRIVGRASSVINVGGQKVHPSEVEAVLNELDGVDASQVYGEADPITGQRVACEIVSALGGDSRVWKRQVRRHCRGKLAAWKIPSQISVVDRLSLNVRLKSSSPGGSKESH